MVVFYSFVTEFLRWTHPSRYLDKSVNSDWGIFGKKTHWQFPDQTVPAVVVKSLFILTANVCLQGFVMTKVKSPSLIYLEVIASVNNIVSLRFI